MYFELAKKECPRFMIFALDLAELSMLLAVTAIVLLVTLELISPYNRRISIFVSRKRLRRAAIVFSVFFLATVGLKIIEIISTLI